MNMRAAEAIVSRAPKAMKIFPISEVWSQVELSLLRCQHGRRRRRAWPRPSRRVCVGGVLLQRAIDIVELIGGDHRGIGGGLALSAGLSAAASRIVLAFAVIALALSAAASAEVSCALALATDAGIVGVLSAAASATSFSAAFLVVGGFRRDLAGLRCA